jgi:hypothetical protein
MKGWLNKEQAEIKFPVNLTPSKARTSLTVPKNRKTSCFYLYEIENIGGD